MGWNDQDDDKPTQGPWGARGGGQKRPPRPDDSIPDLDDILRQATSLFGGGGAKSPQGHGRGLALAGIILLVLWLGSGLYRLESGENAAILTFGKYTSTRVEPGLGYHMPWPVQSVMKVNVAFTRRLEVGFRGEANERNNIPTESQMLTGDENIVDIDFVVTWRISDARDFLFRIRDPNTTVRRVGESAMREIIGRSEIQKALTEGRADIEARTKELMQRVLDQYRSGVAVDGVQLLSVDPPHDVVDAFDDVQRARADMERAKNEAETYRNDIVPRARGEAQKTLQDASAYKQSVLSKAQGEAGRFDSVYAAYAAAPGVTTRRIYIETMQSVLTGGKKIVLGSEKAPLLPYLPLMGAAEKKDDKP